MGRIARWLLVLAVAFVLPLSACGTNGDQDEGNGGIYGGPSDGNGAAEDTGPADSGEDAADGSTIDMRGNSFQPSEIEVPAGTSVTWTNSDSVSHTVTNPDFDSGSIPPGETYSRTFDEPGTYEIQCTIHPPMRGTVVVSE